ncbi:MAG: hypothetical protein ACFFDF_12880 [Candidatus Odinarchaeota archaeon]
MDQIFSFMEIMKELLMDGYKRRTNRAFSKFRDKCRIGDIMHIYIKQRTPESEFLFDARCINKFYWNINDAPEDEKLARKIESPIENETWEEFALKDGFNFYQEFLDYFRNHPKKTLDFICFIFTPNLMEQYKIPNFRQITEFIEV